MKKTFTILGILVVAALVATLWERVDDAFLRKTHPQKYAESVEKYAAEYDVPESVVYAVIKTESGFTPDAVSLKGAIGLMQITPDTFDWLCSKTGGEANALLLYEPDTNIRYGTYFLSLLHNEYKAWDTVYAAYNAIPVKDKGIVHGIGMGHGCFGTFYQTLGDWVRNDGRARAATVTLDLPKDGTGVEFVNCDFRMPSNTPFVNKDKRSN